MIPVRLLGAGLWAPGFANRATWCSGDRDPTVTSPAARLIPAAHQRRATLLARMTAAALEEALATTSLSASEVALILGSAGGELAHTFANLGLMGQDPPSSSPLRFGNSVHNAALGHLSLATGNHLYASALAIAPPFLVAGALLEAIGQVVDAGAPVALLLADETWPGEYFAPMAAAFVLAPDAPGPAVRLHLADRPGTHQAPCPDPAVRNNPCGAALDLLHASQLGQDADVALGSSPLTACLRWS